MTQSYIGIAGPKGLHALQLEDENTALTLARRVARAKDSRTVCFWAVLSDRDAREAFEQIRRGELFAALTTLDRMASCVGRVLPPD